MRRLDYIAHHGIKGQKWGVRRYQNPDGSLTEEGRKHYSSLYKLNDTDLRLTPGTKMQRISSNKTGDAKSGDTMYVSYTNKDNKFYAEKYSHELMDNLIASGKSRFDELNVYKLDIRANDAILAPSQRKRVEEFIKLYEQDRIGMSKELGKETLAMQLKTSDSGAKRMLGNNYSKYVNYYAKQFENASGDDIVKEGYRAFSASFYRDTKYKSDFFNSMAKKGYNAIADDNDIAQGLEMPLVLLNPKNHISITKAEQILSIDDLDPMRR